MQRQNAEGKPTQRHNEDHHINRELRHGGAKVSGFGSSTQSVYVCPDKHRQVLTLGLVCVSCACVAVDDGRLKGFHRVAKGSAAV